MMKRTSERILNMGSHNQGWQKIRSVEAVDTPLAVGTMDCKPAYAMNIASSLIRGMQFIVAAVGANNGVVQTRLYGGRGSAGPAILIADITWTLGQMVVLKDPQTQESSDLQRYADTAAVTAYWPLDIKTPNSGNDMVCVASFDGLDIDWIAAEVLTLTNATKANIYMGYFG